MVTAEEQQQPVDGNLKSAAVRWLFGQEANTVALYLILAALGYFAWYMVTVGIPSHLTQIQTGYEKVEKNHADAYEKVTSELKTTVEKVSESFDKSLDRIERVYDGKLK